MRSTPCQCATSTLLGGAAPWQYATATPRIKLRRASGALPRTAYHSHRARGALPRRCAVRTRGSAAPARPHVVRHTAVRHCHAVAHGSALLPRAWTRPSLQCYRGLQHRSESFGDPAAWLLALSSRRISSPPKALLHGRPRFTRQPTSFHTCTAFRHWCAYMTPHVSYRRVYVLLFEQLQCHPLHLISCRLPMQMTMLDNRFVWLTPAATRQCAMLQMIRHANCSGAGGARAK